MYQGYQYEDANEDNSATKTPSDVVKALPKKAKTERDCRIAGDLKDVQAVFGAKNEFEQVWDGVQSGYQYVKSFFSSDAAKKEEKKEEDHVGQGKKWYSYFGESSSKVIKLKTNLVPEQSVNQNNTNDKNAQLAKEKQNAESEKRLADLQDALGGDTEIDTLTATATGFYNLVATLFSEPYLYVKDLKDPTTVSDKKKAEEAAKSAITPWVSYHS